MRAVHANCLAAFRHAGASQTCFAEAAVGKQSHVVVVVVVVVGCLLFHGNEALVGAQQHWTERC